MERKQLTRRALLTGGTTALIGAALGDLTDQDGNLHGGTMALSEAYNVAGDLWIGPDSAKANVDAKSGRLYIASDTDVTYHGDSGNWNKQAVGSQSEPVPGVYSDSVETDHAHSNSFDFDVRVWNDGETVFVENSSGIITTGDYTNRQETNDALQTALEQGGIISIGPGTYTVVKKTTTTEADSLNPALTVTDDNTIVCGHGRDTHIRVPDNGTPDDHGYPFFKVAANYVVLTSFMLDGNWHNNTPISNPDMYNIEWQGSHGLVHNLYSVRATGDGVEMSTAEDGIIANSHILDSWEHAIHTNTGKSIQIVGNVLDTEENNGIIHMYCGSGSVTRNINITGNLLRNGNDQGIGVSAQGDIRRVNIDGNILENITGRPINIRTSEVAEHISVSNNIIWNGGDAGVWIGGGTASNHIKVTDNIIGECPDGIELNSPSGSDYDLRGNTVVNPGNSGVLLANLQNGEDTIHIKDNIIYDDAGSGGSSTFGVRIGSGSTDYNDMVIEGNAVNGPNFGLSVAGAEPQVVRNNTGLYIDRDTATLTAGASPAARINVGSEEKAQYEPQYIHPNGTPPNSNYAYDWYLERDTTNSNWDMIIEWKTDPGSDMGISYAVDKVIGQ